MPREFSHERRPIRGLHVTLMLAMAMATLAACATPLETPPETVEGECFDVAVSAKIVQQTPTVILGCGDDCVVMSWPWVLDLDVRRVHAGRLKLGPLAVLSLQHTWYRDDLGSRRWWLRRNASGGFNAVGSAGGKCPAETPPARPYFDREGVTLDDLRREGEERYGKLRS